MTKTAQQVQVTTFTCANDSWYTPDWLIEQSRWVLGTIDLDPCSSEIANKIVRATSIYTAADNGLEQPWHGRIFCNPPSRVYRKGDPDIVKTAKPHLWASKLVKEFDAGNVTSAILLVKSVLGYKWYESLYYNYWCCHLADRPAFIRPDGSDSGPCKKGVSVFYFGNSEYHFTDTFAPYGKIVPPLPILDIMIKVSR